MARVVFATTGSLGDVNPYIALAAGLRARGHTCTVATSQLYRDSIESVGARFAVMRPELSSELFSRLLDLRHGARTWFRGVQMPVIEEAYEDVSELVRDADLLVSANLTYAAPLVAEVTGIPWITTKFSVLDCMSAYDPPYSHHWGRTMRAIRHSPAVTGWVIRCLRRGHRVINLARLGALRDKLGLPRSDHPEYWGAVRPRLELRLFSPLIGRPQSDWPAYATQTGFVLLDDVRPSPPLAPELESFLRCGPPPIVFTLGSRQFTESNRRFLRASFEAAQRIDRRAVLLIGNERNREGLPPTLPPTAFAIDQAPHGALFSRAAAIVHHCGMGTLAQALRAGRPQLGVPFMFDQPDNSARLSMLGVGAAVHCTRYTAERAAQALSRLLTEPHFERRAAEVAAEIGAERGLDRACAAIEAVLEGARAGFGAGAADSLAGTSRLALSVRQAL